MQKVAEEVWIADMAASRAGFDFGARMTVIRLPSGGLWIHSPILLTSRLKSELDALGSVAAVVAPSRMHYEHVPEFAAAYPGARVCAVPGSERKLAPKLQVDTVLGDAPDPLWVEVMDGDELRQILGLPAAETPSQGLTPPDAAPASVS